VSLLILFFVRKRKQGLGKENKVAKFGEGGGDIVVFNSNPSFQLAPGRASAPSHFGSKVLPSLDKGVSLNFYKSFQQQEKRKAISGFPTLSNPPKQIINDEGLLFTVNPLRPSSQLDKTTRGLLPGRGGADSSQKMQQSNPSPVFPGTVTLSLRGLPQRAAAPPFSPPNPVNSPASSLSWSFNPLRSPAQNSNDESPSFRHLPHHRSAITDNPTTAVSLMPPPPVPPLVNSFPSSGGRKPHSFNASGVVTLSAAEFAKLEDGHRVIYPNQASE